MVPEPVPWNRRNKGFSTETGIITSVAHKISFNSQYTTTVDFKGIIRNIMNTSLTNIGYAHDELADVSAQDLAQAHYIVLIF